MSAYSDKVIADGASHYWRLNETSGLSAVDSVGTAHGTISGGVTLGQPGAVTDGTTAMAFDGGQTTKIVTGVVTLPSVCTVEAWAKTLSSTANKCYVGGRPNISLILGIGSSGQVLVYIAGFVYSTGVIGGGGWHHVVVTFGETTTIYIDGVLDTAVAQSFPGGTEVPLLIGADSDVNNGWNGGIDEVAIYPTALTPAQIAAHYTLGTTVAGEGRRPLSFGYWKKVWSAA